MRSVVCSVCAALESARHACPMKPKILMKCVYECWLHLSVVVTKGSRRGLVSSHCNASTLLISEKAACRPPSCLASAATNDAGSVDPAAAADTL
jgi:hypothetical protein